MNRAQKILQAYRNTPWRRQTQMLSRLAAVGVVFAFVMMVYTWMTSQAGPMASTCRNTSAPPWQPSRILKINAPIWPI